MRRAAVFLWLGAGILALALAAGCAAGRRDEPFTRALDVSNPRLALGQRVFCRNCNICHPGGAAGYGPPIADPALPGWYISLRVRNGLGAMPPFDQNRLPQEELDAVVNYLQALHRL